MRLFVALNLPSSVIHFCTSVQEQIGHLLTDEERSSIRFIPPERLHITIRPPMLVDQQNLEKLVETLKSASCPSFGLCTSTIGVFSESQILWLGIKESQELTQLVDALERVTHPFGAHEKKGNKNFIGHITLARSINPNNGINEAINRFNSQLPTHCFLVTDFVLKETVLNTEGKVASYTDRYLFPAKPKTF